LGGPGPTRGMGNSNTENNTNFTCYDTSRAPDRRQAPHTGRGSDSLVLIEAEGFYPKFYGIFDVCSAVASMVRKSYN